MKSIAVLFGHLLSSSLAFGCVEVIHHRTAPTASSKVYCVGVRAAFGCLPSCVQRATGQFVAGEHVVRKAGHLRPRSAHATILNGVPSSSSSYKALHPGTGPAEWGPADASFEYEVLSDDPRVYLVHNLLSHKECKEYIDRAKSLSAEVERSAGLGNTNATKRMMTKSNPPEVSLKVKKLWPLPFLSLFAALPSVLRLAESAPPFPATDDIIRVALPPIGIALVLSALLAAIVTQLVRQFSNESSRTSEAVAMNDVEDMPFIRDLVGRVGSVTEDHPWTAFEAPVITRYQPGTIFARHNDASPTRGSEWSDLGGQRVVTAIVYLNTCREGGGTRFDRLGLTVQPREGSALVFYPADRTTLEADDRTRHESLPAVEEKWIVQLFGRVGPRVPPPLGIPNSFGG